VNYEEGIETVFNFNGYPINAVPQLGFKTGTYAKGCLTVHTDDWSNFIGNFSRGSNGIVRVKQ
jgi:hypothetical protein